MKSPRHPKPSGDREIARLFLKALKSLGHDVEIISHLRSWEGYGSGDAQKQIRLAAKNELEQLLAKYANQPAPEMIFTYHVYHKAPDWIGSEVADALKIPYVIAEASYAPRQINGPWNSGHRQTLKCIRQADCIISINPIDIGCLEPLVKKKNVIRKLKPFLDDIPEDFYRQGDGPADTRNQPDDRGPVNLITVAMMRHGDKKNSYWRLSQALKRLHGRHWRLTVIGDGDAAAEIKPYFNDLSGKCLFAGECDHQVIYEHLSNSDLFVWPAVNEALGLALLEAQAFGLPVVAQNHGGVSSIVEHKVTGFVTPAGDLDEYVLALNLLLTDKHKRLQMSAAAKRKFSNEHSFDVALIRIESILRSLRI